ncbi:hypothetical protein Voja6_00227 [Pseudomonas phage vB_PpuM-Voja-6]
MATLGFKRTVSAPVGLELSGNKLSYTWYYPDEDYIRANFRSLQDIVKKGWAVCSNADLVNFPSFGELDAYHPTLGVSTTPVVSMVELTTTHLAGDHKYLQAVLLGTIPVLLLSDGVNWRNISANNAIVATDPGGEVTPPAPLNSLKMATQWNAIHWYVETPIDIVPGATEARYVSNMVHFVGGGALKTIALSFPNWYLYTGDGPVANGGSALPLDKAVIEYNSIVVPVTFNGARSKLIPDGASDVVCDEIPASAFGLEEIPNLSKLLVRTQFTFAAGGKIVFSDRKVSAVPGTQVMVGNTANTQFSDIDLPGQITYSGTYPEMRVSGYCPFVIGRHTDPDAVAIAAIGDSITVGVGDYEANPSGTGWFQRVIGKLPGKPAAINLSVAGTISLAGSTDDRLQDYFKYCNKGIAFYGTNDMSFGATPDGTRDRLKNRVLQMKSKGIQTVGVAKCLMKTTSTDSWATEDNQTLESAIWGAGNTIEQFNDLLPLSGFDFVIPFLSVRGVTDKYKWRPMGTADGIHPAVQANKDMCDEALPLMQSAFYP